MKLFVQFRDEDETRFVVLCDPGDLVAALRRRIVADFREVFPGKPPLLFFRMASAADGYFLTDAARIGEVLGDSETVLCERADKEAPSLPLRESPDEVEDVLGVFRSQLAYVSRAACHAAMRGASAAAGASEAMSIVLAMLVVGGGGPHFAEVRAEALSSLQRGLCGGSSAAVPAFVAAGGLFVLLSLLSPSTRLDSNPEVLEAAARLVEQLASEHSDVLAPLFQDCTPSVVLQKLAADSRCSASVQRRVLAARRMLEPRGIRADSAPGRRPRSSDRSERLRAAGARVAAGGFCAAGGSVSSSAEATDSRAAESSIIEDVSQDDFMTYSRSLARTLSKGHESLRQEILAFLETQGQSLRDGCTSKSNFAPFEFRAGRPDVLEVERILVSITVQRKGGSFQVSYKSSFSIHTPAHGSKPAGGCALPPKAAGRHMAAPLQALLKGDAETQRQALSQVEACSTSGDGIQELAASSQFAEALVRAIFESAVTASPTGAASWLAVLGRVVAQVAGDRSCRAALRVHLAAHMLQLSGKAGHPASLRELVEKLKVAWPKLPLELRSSLPALLSETFTGSSTRLNVAVATKLPGFFLALLDANAPDDLQCMALRVLRVVISAGSRVADITRSSETQDIVAALLSTTADGGALTPKLVNAALLRAIPRHPLLCLEVLGGLALKDHFRSFFCTQMSLLQFLAHCCEQPEAAAASAGSSQGRHVVSESVGGGSCLTDAVGLQRAAARCLANLSAHPVARDWARRSPGLRAALTSADDVGTRTYLSVVLGIPELA